MELMVKAMKVEVGNPLRKLVLLKLADNASDSGECWPSYQHIADQCEVTRRSVMTHIKKLEEDGFLRVVKRRKSSTESMTNIYVLSLDRGSENNSLGSEGDSLGSERDSLGGSEGDSPRTSHSFEPVNEPNKKINKKEKPSPRKRPKFEAPSFEQVYAYALERGRQDLAKKFFDYYEAPDEPNEKWKDKNGNQVRNWKQKFITWENSNPIQQSGVNYGNGNGGQQLGGFRETESQRAKRLNAELSEQARANGFNGSRSTPDHF